jgi:hypothetical protein
MPVRARLNYGDAQKAAETVTFCTGRINVEAIISQDLPEGQALMTLLMHCGKRRHQAAIRQHGWAGGMDLP